MTFAAGVYTSIFGSSKQPINSHYARELFARDQGEPVSRSNFKVIVGGSGGWQITQTNTWDELGVDCVVEGRSESADTLDAVRPGDSRRGAAAPGRSRPSARSRRASSFPDKRTTFGVVEMTTGCGRRCQFCLPDLNPQIDLPKDQIMAAVRANVRDGNKQISLATEDMFIWGQVHTDTPFYFPNREALLDLYSSDRQHAGRRAARAQPRDDRAGRRRSGADREAVGRAARQEPDPAAAAQHASRRSKALVPLIGLETGSVRVAKQIMPSKGVPFPIDDWPSVVIRGLEVLNENNWFPAMTLIVGNPGETDDDVKATLDLIYEVERRGLFAFFIPSIFTPLHDTRMEKKKGVTETRQLTPLQWQLMMKCWKMNLRPGSDELVGADGVAHRRDRAVGVEAAQAERAGLHVAAVHVRQRAARDADGQDGQDLSGPADAGSRPARNCSRRSSPTCVSFSGRTPATCRPGGQLRRHEKNSSRRRQRR